MRAAWGMLVGLGGPTVTSLLSPPVELCWVCSAFLPWLTISSAPDFSHFLKSNDVSSFGQTWTDHGLSTHRLCLQWAQIPDC